MKKLLILLLSLCIICSIGAFTACNGASSESSSSVETVEDKVESKARSVVTSGVYVKYGYVPYVNITNVSESYTGNKYYVSGKYKVRDNYGDDYTGKFDLTIVYDPETDTCEVTEKEIQPAYKD